MPSNPTPDGFAQIGLNSADLSAWLADINSLGVGQTKQYAVMADFQRVSVTDTFFWELSLPSNSGGKVFMVGPANGSWQTDRVFYTVTATGDGSTLSGISQLFLFSVNDASKPGTQTIDLDNIRVFEVEALVPEPGTLALLTLGGLLLWKKRRTV